MDAVSPVDWTGVLGRSSRATEVPRRVAEVPFRNYATDWRLSFERAENRVEVTAGRSAARFDVA